LIGAAKKTEILDHGEISIQAEPLRHVAKSLPDPVPLTPDIQAKNTAAPSGRSGETAKHSDGGGFASAVCAQETKDFSALHRHRDSVDRERVAVSLNDSV
jgi:hypothetical protein